MLRYTLPALLLLAGCGAQNDNDPGVGGVTVGEARALNEAAAKLDARHYDPTAKNEAAKAK